MGHTITLVFELLWLVMLSIACTVGLLARRPGGRRWLRRWFKLPTIIWWETERAIDPGGDVAGVIAELRSSVPGAGRALLPPWLLVRVTEDGAGATKVTLRAATLMQAKTATEAAARITDAVATLTEGNMQVSAEGPLPNGHERETRLHADLQ
ncbi:MAG: hypothetical protein ACJ789_05450 [Thermomicrobiales bacterium]